MRKTMQPAPAGDRAAGDFSLVARLNILIASALMALLVLLVATALQSKPAFAHCCANNGWGSVDGYERVHYTDYYTDYPATFARGVDNWNYVAWWYDYYGPDFKYDYYENHLDLYADNFYSTGTWYARWESSLGADEIYFNERRMYGLTSYNRRKVSTHELGHALGFRDLGDSWYYYSIMYGYFPPYDEFPLDHDYYDYDYNWV